MVSNRNRPDHLRCPQCQAESGRPLKVESRTSDVAVTMRCSSCKHEWILDQQPKDPLLIPKPDRRKKSAS